MDELQEFFKKVLQIPSENIKEFIFDKKKYTKFDDDKDMLLTGVLFWFVDEWHGDSWARTDTVIATHLKMISYPEVKWYYELDMSKEIESPPTVVNKSGDFLIDLE